MCVCRSICMHVCGILSMPVAKVPPSRTSVAMGGHTYKSTKTNTSIVPIVSDMVVVAHTRTHSWNFVPHHRRRSTKQFCICVCAGSNDLQNNEYIIIK